MEKKHILVVCQYFYPESFRINEMCREWVARGYQVTVLTGIPNYPQGKFYKGYNWFKKRREQWEGIDIRRIPLIARGKSPIGMILNYLSFMISGWFWKWFTGVKPDYVFTFQLSPVMMALPGVWIAKRRKVPHYLYVQDLWPDNFEAVTGIHSGVILRRLRKMVDKIYRRSDKIFATSPSFVEMIRERLCENQDKVMYLPQYAEDHYVPCEREAPDDVPSDDRFKIVFTGNVGFAQGLDVLPETAALLQDRGIDDVCFVIVGEGRGLEAFRAQVKERDVESAFVFTGRRPSEEVPRYLAACDMAFVSFKNDPVLVSTIPAKLQSYMACAMPILAAAGGETERVVNEAACGVCCAVGDAKALCEAIVSAKATDLSPYAQASLAYSKAHFNKDTIMDQLDPFFT
ncbi:MAG: glycosyltransferase family 4 protein [Clostridia bacterium]|nr:glycosyltransferase family 4 protein [Clostridia bacterium]